MLTTISKTSTSLCEVRITSLGHNFEGCQYTSDDLQRRTVARCHHNEGWRAQDRQ